MYRSALSFAVLVFSTSLWAASLNFNGHYRGEHSYHSNVGLGSGVTSKSYSLMRALLKPRLVIDDHFSVKSQWSLLTSPSLTPAVMHPSSNTFENGQGGYVLGDASATAFQLSRAWLEWTSDFGVLRIGRMPFSWGYGILYDAGDRIWDDFQTTLDRVEYQLHLGYVVGGFALSAQDSSTFYSVYLKYKNPESQVEGGILYEKQARSSLQGGALLNANGNMDDRIGVPGMSKTPYPLSNNVVDIYLKKSMRYLTIGGEISWIAGNAVDYGGNSASGTDELNAFAFLVSASYNMQKVKLFTDFLYASGDSNLNSDQLTGFVLLHRNRRPGLILGRELLGANAGNTVTQGSLVAYGGTDSFSGVYYIRPGVRIDWSRSWATGLEVIYAAKAATTTGESADLGLEIDLGVTHAVHKNADLGLNFGILFAGAGITGTSGTTFAGQATLGIKF